jgi:ankyrin repeat protein
LHAACASGLVKVVRELLQRGANVNARDAQQQTPAHAAIISKIFEVNQLDLNKIFLRK